MALTVTAADDYAILLRNLSANLVLAYTVISQLHSNQFRQVHSLKVLIPVNLFSVNIRHTYRAKHVTISEY